MEATLQTALSDVTKEMISQLQQFTPEAFNRKTNESCWSAAEVAEHLVIIATNINRVLQADGEVADRDPMKKVPVMQQALQDRNTKREAPESVRPTGNITDQALLVQRFQEQMQLMEQVLTNKDLNVLCTVYPHPALGRLTRMEWIYFIIFHTERHAKQLADLAAETAG